MKIAIVGTGYVGLSLAILIAQNNSVECVDISQEKVNLINRHVSPIKDEYVERYLKEKELHLSATTNAEEAYRRAEYIIVAVPTNYDSDKKYFDTSQVEQVVREILNVNTHAVIVIKSTIPVGYTALLREKFHSSKIIFSPEFLRETKALYDNLYPSRIIVGTDLNDEWLRKKSEEFANLLSEGALKQDINKMLMGFTEAEAVKLFSNTYLALRISYFNELDTYAELKGFDSKAIISGVCADPRIGDYYNNPSFGYGGYCLPKDTKQLLANFSDVPQNIISAVVDSNNTRKEYIAENVLKFIRANKEKCSGRDKDEAFTVGVFHLSMKNNSDNFRESSILRIIEQIQERDVRIIIYEPALDNGSYYNGNLVVNDIAAFKRKSACIIANRYDKILDDIKDKVYTRDVYCRD